MKEERQELCYRFLNFRKKIFEEKKDFSSSFVLVEKELLTYLTNIKKETIILCFGSEQKNFSFPSCKNKKVSYQLLSTKKEIKEYQFDSNISYFCILDASLFSSSFQPKFEEIEYYLNLYKKEEKINYKFPWKDIYKKLKNDCISNGISNYLFLSKKAKKKNISFSSLLGIVNDNLYLPYFIFDLHHILYVNSIESVEQKISYIYDFMCSSLKNEFISNSICDFRCDKCIAKRIYESSGGKGPFVYGCCYTKGRVCKYLVHGNCTVDSVSCRLFSCRYLKSLGISYFVSDFLLCKFFLNFRQRKILDDGIAKPKEEMMKLLLKKK